MCSSFIILPNSWGTLDKPDLSNFTHSSDVIRENERGNLASIKSFQLKSNHEQKGKTPVLAILKEIIPIQNKKFKY